jgi:hypothetical protein
MKLELKHLAGYLPYGLTVKVKYGWCTMLTLNDWSINTDCKESYYYETLEETDFKPILRPLSDLTKEIEVEGEKFVPALRTQLHMFSALPLVYDNMQVLENRITTNTISYSDMQYLISLHFDVFKLIPAGLAIDINTLNK